MTSARTWSDGAWPSREPEKSLRLAAGPGCHLGPAGHIEAPRAVYIRPDRLGGPGARYGVAGAGVVIFFELRIAEALIHPTTDIMTFWSTGPARR